MLWPPRSYEVLITCTIACNLSICHLTIPPSRNYALQNLKKIYLPLYNTVVNSSEYYRYIWHCLWIYKQIAWVNRKLSTCVHCAKCQLRLYTVLYNCIWIKMSGSTQLFYFNYDISHLKVSQRLIQLFMSKRRAVNVYLLIIMLSITISLTQFINDIAHHVSPPPPPPTSSLNIYVSKS